MKPIFLISLLLTLIVLNGCQAMDQETTSANPAVKQETQDTSGSKPTGVGFKADGTTFLYKNGLDVHNEEPTDEPSKAAWEFFKLRGEQKYDKALKYLEGYDSDDLTSLYAKYTDAGRIYLEEVTSAKLVRWADITNIAPKENEDENAYVYKIIYLEMELKTRGKLTASQTDMHNGLNIYAVHLKQAKKDDPWVITMLGCAPPLEK